MATGGGGTAGGDLQQRARDAIAKGLIMNYKGEVYAGNPQEGNMAPWFAQGKTLAEYMQQFGNKGTGSATSMATGGIGMAGGSQSIDDPIARQLRQRQSILNARNNVPGNEAAAMASTLQTDENSVYAKMGVNTPTAFNVPNGYTGSVSPLTQTAIRTPEAYQQDANDQENLTADQAEYARQQSGGQSNVGFRPYGQPRMDTGGGGKLPVYGGGGGGAGSDYGGGSPYIDPMTNMPVTNLTPATRAVRERQDNIRVQEMVHPGSAELDRLNEQGRPLDIQQKQNDLRDRPQAMQLEEQDRQAELNGLVPYDDPTQGHVYLTPTEAKIRKARDTRDIAKAISERYPETSTGLDKLSPGDAIQGILHPEDLASAFGGDSTKATTVLNQYLQDKGYSPRAIEIQVAQARAEETKKAAKSGDLDSYYKPKWELAFPGKPYPGWSAAASALPTAGDDSTDTASTSLVPGEDASAIDDFIKKYGKK